MIDPNSFDWVGENTTRAIRKRDFKAVALSVICWLLVAAVLPAVVYWMMGA
jgi:hypothetical protein